MVVRQSVAPARRAATISFLKTANKPSQCFGFSLDEVEALLSLHHGQTSGQRAGFAVARRCSIDEARSLQTFVVLGSLQVGQAVWAFGDRCWPVAAWR